MLAKLPASLIDVFCGFPQSVQLVEGSVSSSISWALPSRFFRSHLHVSFSPM